jgi:hypothetical protein
MEGEKEKIKNELELASEQTEMRILNKELQAIIALKICQLQRIFLPKMF